MKKITLTTLIAFGIISNAGAADLFTIKNIVIERQSGGIVASFALVKNDGDELCEYDSQFIGANTNSRSPVQLKNGECDSKYAVYAYSDAYAGSMNSGETLIVKAFQKNDLIAEAKKNIVNYYLGKN
ncbi:MAG: hypothetical protein IT286_02960 [Proteobacteria bacterium]|nr:hypothetical protein [Pseudomonadota bacterium]